MFERFEMQDDTPRDIVRFEQLMLASLMLGVVVATVMYDHLLQHLGGLTPVALFMIVLYGASLALMYWTSRRRSNLGRWLISIGSVLCILPYLAHVMDMFHTSGVVYVSMLELALQAAAIQRLFTRTSRAWFAETTPLDTVPESLG
ncbi:MAG: hypothetical protein NTV97_00600 [Alphaproteobacteria bacterium]|nr:hypothetical protein [Alphaproteobacteria bacterium]